MEWNGVVWYGMVVCVVFAGEEVGFPHWRDRYDDLEGTQEA